MKYTLPIAAAMHSTLFSVSLFWGQVLPSEPVGKNSDLSFAYDWDGLDEGGNGDQVDAAEFIFREFPPVSPPVPPLRVLRAKAVVIGQNTYKVTPVLSNVPDREYTLTTPSPKHHHTFVIPAEDVGNIPDCSLFYKRQMQNTRQRYPAFC